MPVFLAVTPAGAPVHAAQPRSPLCPVDHPSSAGPPTSNTRVGVAMQAQVNGDTTCLIRLNGVGAPTGA